MSAIANTYLLGDLAVQLEVVTQVQVEQSLAISSDTGLPLGRVLVLSGLVGENDLSNLIRCQTLLREELVQIAMARRAFSMVRGTTRNIDDSLIELGWEKSLEKRLSPLGELLVDSGIISDAQLESYLRQQPRVKLPLGRMLVSSGVISDSFLSTALNVQMMVRQKRLDRPEAIEVLVEARKRQLQLTALPKAKNFYEQAVQNVPKLGELLVLSGVISESKLLEALELSLIGRKSIGELLLEKRYLSKTQLDNILLLQASLADGTLRLPQLKSVLRRLDDGFSLTDSISQAAHDVPGEVSGDARLMTFFEFLKSLDHTSGANIDQAFEMAKKNQRLVKQALLISGMLDEPTVELVEQCYSLYEDRRYSFDDLCTLYEYSRRRNIQVKDALEELRWLKKPPCIVVEPAVASTRASDSSLLKVKEMAEQLIALKDYGNARLMYEQLVLDLQAVQDNRYRYCLERVAFLCCEQGDYLSAEEYQTKLTGLNKTAYGEVSMQYVQSLSNLGKALYFQGRTSDAIANTKEYIASCSALLGADHPDVACGWQNLGMLQFQTDDILGAMKSYFSAHKICLESLGPNHPTTLNLLNKLNNMQERLRQLERADHAPPDLSGIVTGNWRTISFGDNFQL